MAKTVLITGASSGIGRELALIAARSCDHLILAARNRNRLQELADRIESDTSCQVLVIKIDLSLPDAAEVIYSQVRTAGLIVDTLINNAGAGQAGPYLQQTAASDQEMIQLNITALTDLCRLFGRDMAARGCGRILNVASTGAYQPGPYIAVYYACKAYVHSFSLALANEWQSQGVQISVLYPGATATEFAIRSGKADLKNAMYAAKVASIAWRDLERGKRTIVPGIGNRWAIRLSKILPSVWMATLVRRIQQRQYEKLQQDQPPKG